MPRWTYQLNFQSPVSIFSGLAVAGMVDRIVMRNAEGLPMVPGSTVKGCWRFTAERLLAALPDNSGGANIYMHKVNEPVCKDPENACILCRWFGSPSMPARIMVSQAQLTDDWCDLFHQLHAQNPTAVVFPDTEVRPGTAVSRRFRTVLGDHLFFDEAVPPVSFQGAIHLTATPSTEEATFLRGAACLVDRIGARKAAGRGILAGGICIGGAS